MIRFHVSYRSGHYITIKKNGDPYSFYTRFYGIDSNQDNSNIYFCYPLSDMTRALSIAHGVSSSSYRQLNGYEQTYTSYWNTQWTTNNLQTFAYEIATHIVNNNAYYVGNKKNINLYIFSGRAIDVATGDEEPLDRIVVLLYEGNDTNADEIIEV